MSQPHILFVLTHADFFFSHRLDLAKAAQKAGYRISLAACGTTKYADSLNQLNITAFETPLNTNNLNIFNEAQNIKYLRRLIEQEKPDLIQPVGLKSCFLSGLARHSLQHIPLCHLLTGLGYFFRNTDTKAKILRGIMPRPLLKKAFVQDNSITVFQNPDDQKTFIDKGLAQPQSSAIVRGSGVNLDDFAPMAEPSSPITVFMAARLLRDKGIFEFINAAKIVYKTHPDIRFVLSGSPDTSNPTSINTTLIQKATHDTPVIWHPHSQDIRGLLQQSHIACLPSYHEGLPKFLLEAAATARAIITTDVPGCRDIVQHNTTGMLVPPRNPTKLAQEIIDLSNNNALRHRLGHAARKRAEQLYDTNKINQDMLKLHSQLITQRRGSSKAA